MKNKGITRDFERNPEKNLWLSVILRAIEDLKMPDDHFEIRYDLSAARGRKPQKNPKEDAVDWFHDGSTHEGSFLWACQATGLEPGRVLERVAKLEQRLCLGRKNSVFH